MPPPDRALNDGFAWMLNATCTTPQSGVELDARGGLDDQAAIWDAFVALGILTKGNPAKSLICDGCEQTCFMPVEILPAYNSAFIVCDKTPNMGRIEIDADDLRRWRSSIEQLAHWLAGELKTNRTPTQYDENGAYNLGPCDIDGTPCEIILCGHVAPEGALGDHLCILIDPQATYDSNTIRLGDIIVFKGGKPHIRKSVLAATLNPKPKSIAVELTLIDNRLMLENCKTGHVVQIAKPHFNGTNARLIEALFANAGVELAIGNAWRLAEVDKEKDIHKALSELGFRKARRKAFISVAKGTILFQPSISQEKLTSLGLSTEDLFDQ